MKTRVIQDEPERRPVVTAALPRGFRARVRDHRLIAFFVLAYVLAWWSWPLYRVDRWPRQAFHAAGALLAALIVIAVAEGRPGLRDLGRRMIRRRVPWYFYALALGLPLLVRFAAVGLTSAPEWSGLAWGSFALVFLIRLVNPLGGPMAEEPARRGFAVPRLRKRHSTLASAVVLGVLVALWHLPLVGDTGWIGLATTFSITIVYLWLFCRTAREGDT